jgi:hypothetical protein
LRVSSAVLLIGLSKVFVNLPLGATKEMLIGTLNVEAASTFSPGQNRNDSLRAN